jgi:hypothetical protein
LYFDIVKVSSLESRQPSLLPKKTEIMGQVTNLKKWFTNILSHNGKWSCSYRASILPQIYTIVHSDASTVFPHMPCLPC